MKTKLFYLLMCLFAFTATNAQINSVAIVGEGIEVGGWPGEANNNLPTGDKYKLTKDLVDPNVWTYSGLIMVGGKVKFRANNSWNTATDTPAGGNWGLPNPLVGSGFPDGLNAENCGCSKDIIAIAGTYDISFNVVTGDYHFTGGPPIAVVKLFGTATNPPSGIFMSTADGVVYNLPANTTLLAGNAQFQVDGNVAGALAFPSGTTTGVATDFIPVTAGKYTSVTYNKDSGEYSFVAAPVFDEIGLIGSGTTGTEAGWSADIAKMTTTDGITYTLKNIQLYSINSTNSTPGAVKFRTYGAWTQDWGGVSFPTGPIVGQNGNIIVTTDGTYDITFNKTTGAYAFSFPEIGLIGSGTTGTQAGWNADIAKMVTTNGVNYTLTQQLYSVNSTTPDAGGPGIPGPGPAAVKFRTYGAWNQDWGGTAFPTGPTVGNNGDIFVSANGNYAIKFNRLTGAYDFGTVLGVNKFDTASFKAYPNPTKNSWNITSGNEDITSVRVYDILGKSVYAKTASSKEVTVNASDLSKGVYFAKVSTAKGTSTVKLVKE